LSDLSPDLIWERHHRLSGSALIVGVGAVGSHLAAGLSRFGVTPITLIDHDTIQPHNIPAHFLGESALWQPKAEALAARIKDDLQSCDVRAKVANFMDLSWSEQVAYARAADVVIGATDEVDCQQQINEACLEAESVAVYPGAWISPSIDPGAIGEILWVLPGRFTPCYRCAMSWRPAGSSARGTTATRTDLQVLVQATMAVTEALLEPTSARGRILNRERTLILVHSHFQPTPETRRLLAGQAMRNFPVPLPPTTCPACKGKQPPIAAFTNTISGRTVQVDASSTLLNRHPTTRPTYIWDWGEDDSPRFTTNATTARHEYDKYGQYTVRLTVADSGNTDVASAVVSINHPVISDFTIRAEGLTATIGDIEIPRDIQTTLVADWDDGSVTLISDSMPRSHTYSEAKRYDVAITGTNSEGSRQIVKSVVVNRPPRIGSIIPEINDLRVNNLHISGDLGVEATCSYSWGDRSPLTSAPAHLYEEAGTYTITVTITNSADRVFGVVQVEVSRASRGRPEADRALRHWFDTVGRGHPNSEVKYQEIPGAIIEASWTSGDHKYFAQYSIDYDRLYVEIQIASATDKIGKRPRMHLANTSEQLESALEEDRRRRLDL
jgi:PKD repeat protein/molybdopterin/thiamine biosynthesis adenylyltransferase